MPKSTAVYALILLLVSFIGVALILASAYDRNRLSSQVVQTIVDSIEKDVPQLSAGAQRQVQNDVEKWDGYASETIANIVFRDLGIALVVAVLLTVIIESYARNRLQDEVRGGVVEAALKRLIPEAIFEDVRVHVLGATLLKERWRFDMNVVADSALKSATTGRYVSRTRQTYRLRNLTKNNVPHVLEVQLDRDKTGVDQYGNPLPRFEQIQIGTETFRAGQPNMAKLLSNEGTRFLKPITIGDQLIAIEIVLSEIVQVPDTFVWSTRFCTDGVAISIEHPTLTQVEFGVEVLHPERSRLTQGAAGIWEFAGGILPWQGFQIRSWEPQQQTPVSVAAPTMTAPANAPASAAVQAVNVASQPVHESPPPAGPETKA